jgi:hypothetical protein
MRALPAMLLIAATLAVVPPAAHATPSAGLRIAELLPNPDPAAGQREFVELWNLGNASVDLAGWTLRDMPTASGSRNEFTFVSGHLAAGARLVVWSNGTPDARGPSWSTSPSKTVWNDAGDSATLLDPSGNVADWLAYGNGNEAAPAGFEAAAKPAAPPRGQSLALADGAWSAGAPSPALAPGVVGGMATATVANVAPVVSIAGLPATVKPGQAVELTLSVHDANGDADVTAWSLVANGVTVAQSPAAPSAYSGVAPAVAGPWAFTLSATDAGGLSAQHSVTAQVRDARLSLQLAGGALRFPELRPGDANVSSLDWATLRNEGTEAVVPLLDVSAFTGPATIPVDGHLAVGLRSGNATAWVDYDGPLTPLPSLPAGATVEMTLRLLDVPTPLAAGAYGTTFAVVAA